MTKPPASGRGFCPLFVLDNEKSDLLSQVAFL